MAADNPRRIHILLDRAHPIQMGPTPNIISLLDALIVPQVAVQALHFVTADHDVRP